MDSITTDKKMSEIATSKTFKSYISFWSGQMFSLLGSSAVQFVIIFWITRTTKSTVYLSIATFFAFLPQWILGPLIGVYVDRWNRKLIIALSDFFQAFTTFIIILLFFFNAETVWVIIIINSIRGLCQAFHWPATNAIIPIMVPKEHLSRLNGLNFFFTGLVNTIGPIIAATLLAILTIEQILWIDVITFLIAIVPLLLIKIPKVVKNTLDKAKKSFFKDLTIVCSYNDQFFRSTLQHINAIFRIIYPLWECIRFGFCNGSDTRRNVCRCHNCNNKKKMET